MRPVRRSANRRTRAAIAPPAHRRRPLRQRRAVAAPGGTSAARCTGSGCLRRPRTGPARNRGRAQASESWRPARRVAPRTAGCRSRGRARSGCRSGPRPLRRTRPASRCPRVRGLRRREHRWLGRDAERAAAADGTVAVAFVTRAHAPVVAAGRERPVRRPRRSCPVGHFEQDVLECLVRRNLEVIARRQGLQSPFETRGAAW